MKRVVMLAMLGLVLLAGCGGDKLAGLWVNVDHPDFQTQYNADGTGMWSGGSADLPFTWEVKDGRICLTFDDGSGDCQKYTLDGERMTMDGAAGVERWERWAGD